MSDDNTQRGWLGQWLIRNTDGEGIMFMSLAFMVFIFAVTLAVCLNLRWSHEADAKASMVRDLVQQGYSKDEVEHIIKLTFPEKD